MENPEAYYGEKPRWLFGKCDFGHHKWSIVNCADMEKDFFSKLADFESMTWSEIFNTSGGRRTGSNHHPIPVQELNKEARKRLEELQLYCDELISLRVGGAKRIFGERIGSDMHILWYTDDHDICPSKKRNT